MKKAWCILFFGLLSALLLVACAAIDDAQYSFEEQTPKDDVGISEYVEEVVPAHGVFFAEQVYPAGQCKAIKTYEERSQLIALLSQGWDAQVQEHSYPQGRTPQYLVALEQYTEDYFDDHHLIFVDGVASSGSYYLAFDKAVLLDDKLTIRVFQWANSDTMTCDVKYYVFLIELDACEYDELEYCIEHSAPPTRVDLGAARYYEDEFVLSVDDEPKTGSVIHYHYYSTWDKTLTFDGTPFVIKTYREFVAWWDSHAEEIMVAGDYRHWSANHLKELSEIDASVFDQYDLLFCGIANGSGSVRHWLEGITLADDKLTVTLAHDKPFLWTNDMAYHLFVLWVPKCEYESVQCSVVTNPTDEQKAAWDKSGQGDRK